MSISKTQMLPVEMTPLTGAEKHVRLKIAPPQRWKAFAIIEGYSILLYCTFNNIIFKEFRHKGVIH